MNGTAGCARPYFFVTSSIGSARRSCLMPRACFQALCDHVESRLIPTTTVFGSVVSGFSLILQFSFSHIGLQSSGYHMSTTFLPFCAESFHSLSSWVLSVKSGAV